MRWALMLVGIAILLPVILGYTVWVYWVFRGKVSADARLPRLEPRAAVAAACLVRRASPAASFARRPSRLLMR